MTPEGKVKSKIDKLLDTAGVYKFKPVQNGMGSPGLDYHCCHQGFALYIEAKAPGKEPTARQWHTIKDIIAAGGNVFVISDERGLEELKIWLLNTRLNK